MTAWPRTDDIAQEAVNNAIKHGESKKILIQLTAEQSRGRLVVKDDGKGITEAAVNSRHGPAHYEVPVWNDRRLT